MHTHTNYKQSIRTTTQPTFYGHYTGQPALAGTSSQELEDFVGAEFCCQHALADSNQCIWIREKMLEFASTVLSTLSPYLKVKQSKRRGNKTMLTMVQCNCCLFSS